MKLDGLTAADGESFTVVVTFADEVETWGQGGTLTVDNLLLTTVAGCPGQTAGACCPNSDVNGDGQVNGLDIAAISSSANFGRAASAADDPCTDVNTDGQVNGLDVAAASSSACFGQTPPGCP